MRHVRQLCLSNLTTKQAELCMDTLVRMLQCLHGRARSPSQKAAGMCLALGAARVGPCLGHKSAL